MACTGDCCQHHDDSDYDDPTDLVDPVDPVDLVDVADLVDPVDLGDDTDDADSDDDYIYDEDYIDTDTDMSQLELRSIAMRHVCERCDKPNPNVFYDKKWIHNECPKRCAYGHVLEKYVSPYIDHDIGQTDYDEVFYCIENHPVTRDKIYPSIFMSDFYNPPF